MRYDIVSKDLLADHAPFSPAPGAPVVTGAVTRVRHEVPVLGDVPDRGASCVPQDEDSVVPLFPEDEAFSDPDYLPEADPPPLRGRVRFRLDEVARLRGLINDKGKHRGQTNLSAIQRGTGLAYATLFKILRKPDEQTGVSFEVLTRLCEFMHCQPGDLLVWEPRAQEPSTSISDYFQRRENRLRAEGPNGGEDDSE